MSAATIWFRLPPAVRLATFTRGIALQHVGASHASSVEATSATSGLPRCVGPCSSRSSRRCYATVDVHNQKALQTAYDFSGSLPKADDGASTEQQGSTGGQHAEVGDLKKRDALEVALWKRANRLNIDLISRRWLKLEVRTARKKSAKDGVAVLRGLLLHERFGSAPVASKPLAAPPQSPSRELTRIIKKMTLPSSDEYPDAPRQLMDPSAVSHGFASLCSVRKNRLQAKETFSVASGNTGQPKHVCSLTICIPGIYEESLSAEASTKNIAKQAAWLKALASVHADGSLKDLMPRREMTHIGDVHMHDIERVRQSEIIPTKEQYPHAPGALFDPALIHNTIAGACGKRKLAMQTDMDTSSRSPSKHITVFACTLQLDLEGLCSEMTIGEGQSKQMARHAAWVRMLVKFHENGALVELFPDPNAHQPYVDEQGEELELAALCKQVMEEEKDAKTEIYNYAASLGYVPHFTAAKVQPRAQRLRARRQAPAAKPVVRVSIGLPELGIEVAGLGADLRIAETAAALAFKAQAELRTKSPTVDHQQQRANTHGILTTDTAKHFFDFLREIRRGVRIEVEHEQVAVASTTRQSACLSLNGEATGQGVTMLSKKQAEAVAYLTAAVHLSATAPELLHEFEARLRKDKGKVLKQLSPIDLMVDTESLFLMRSALLEAKQAGLPDSPEVLSAEELGDPTERQRRRRKQSSHAEIDALNKHLIEKQNAFDTNSGLRELREKKATLPMNQYRAEVIDMISSNPYSIVVGATGSGKTTQVPQILLEHQIAAGNGGACNIVCTQPRRIAATSVAQRVAVERDEPLQRSVGYQVRFDTKLPEPGGSITYCTTGVLLEQLKHDPAGVLDVVSHLVIDEVHERDINIDFLMIVMKKALTARREAGKTVPKVVLMSATLDTDLFANYFGTVEDGVSRPCPSLSVPGRTFPVKEEYLGSIVHDLLENHRAELNAVLAMDNVSQDYLKAETAYSTAPSAVGIESSTDSVIDWKREKQLPLGADDASTAASEREEGQVPTALMAAAIGHICKTSSEGALLAFLPGLEEIMKTQRHLQAQPLFGIDFGDPKKFRICPLHSTIPKEEQAKIFEPVPPGCRKIILSTNIAETSVTVTDIKYVIDSGKLRETRYDQIRRISKLQCVWESKSNSKQRAGRAGRVQDGYYYALFSKERHDSMRAVGLPELLRTDLQATLLSIKAQNFTDPVQSFLAQAIEPPPTRTIVVARENLQAIEAFTEDERLTDLGRLLSKLPVHPTLSKMIVLGVVFRCLDPMLILGATAEERSLFVTPVSREARAAANAARRSYADGDSDHLAMLNAFREIRTLRDQYGFRNAWERARDRFIHMGAFRAIDQTAEQIVQILEEAGLISPAHRGDGRGGGGLYGPAAMNRNAANPELIKSLLLAGCHPNLGAKSSPKGATYRTASEHGVLMHPSSLNDDAKRRVGKHKYGTLFTYSTMGRSNDGNSLFMRDSTLVSPLMAVLFGGEVHMSNYNRLDMDEWMPFFVQANDRHYATKLILEFRKALDRVLNTAFRSLASRDAGRGLAFVEDPIREQFTQRVVQSLNLASGQFNTSLSSRHQSYEASLTG